jgi:hypothetical protein
MSAGRGHVATTPPDATGGSDALSIRFTASPAAVTARRADDT